MSPKAVSGQDLRQLPLKGTADGLVTRREGRFLVGVEQVLLLLDVLIFLVVGIEEGGVVGHYVFLSHDIQFAKEAIGMMTL